MAEVGIDNGIGRDITKDETLALPDRAEEVGMVLQPENNQKPLFVCCCCGCCCGVLTSAKKIPHPSEYFHSNFFAEVDPDLCEGGETCLQRCRMNAISPVDHVAEVDRDRCIGCGLCATTCETNAMELKKKEQEGPDFNVVPVFSLDCRRTVNRSFREQGHIEIESQPGPLADSGTYPIYSIFGINAHLMNQSPVSGSLSRQTMPPF